MLMAPCAKIPMLSKKSPRVSKVKSRCTREFAVGHIKEEYVNTKYNISDLFTKGVSKETFLALEGFLIGREPISKLFEAIRKQMEQGNEEPQ